MLDVLKIEIDELRFWPYFQWRVLGVCHVKVEAKFCSEIRDQVLFEDELGHFKDFSEIWYPFAQRVVTSLFWWSWEKNPGNYFFGST